LSCTNFEYYLFKYKSPIHIKNIQRGRQQTEPKIILKYDE
jgi:hypothetical protein